MSQIPITFFEKLASPESEKYLYLGDRNTNGSWRFIVENGSLKIEVRVGGVWIVKDTINP